MLSKTFKVLIKWIVIGKNISESYLFWTMVHQRGSIQFITFLSQSFVQANFVTSQIRHSSLWTAVFQKFLMNFFFSNISDLSKNIE